MRRRRTPAAFTLAAYLAAVLLAPVLHRRHHARYGADHTHGAGGPRALAALPQAVLPSLQRAQHHAAFDADLGALDLADVAHAGAVAVDCALASYTLVECDASDVAHPHTFGDQLLGHEHAPPQPQPFDPEHGRGALEHLCATLIGTPPFLLPPPLRPLTRVASASPTVRCGALPHQTQRARGPPPPSDLI